MNKSDILKRIEPLNAEEVKMLKKNASDNYVGFMIVAITIGVLLVTFFGLMPAFIFFSCLLAFNARRKLLSDAEGGVKNVITGEIKDKWVSSSNTSNSYHIAVEHENFYVQFPLWDRLNCNQIVEVHFSEKSRYVFDVKILAI